MLEYHLSIEVCELKPERLTIRDLAKKQYASRLEEAVSRVPSLVATDPGSPSSQTQSAKQGWALKEMKKPYLLSMNQKFYLEAKSSVS